MKSVGAVTPITYERMDTVPLPSFKVLEIGRSLVPSDLYFTTFGFRI